MSMRSEYYRDDREQARCDRCRSPFMREPGARFKTLCPTCFKAERDRDAYLRGWQEGHAAALASRSAAIPPDRLRALVRLTHPDLHGGSKLATETCAWLLELRRRVPADAEVVR